MTATVVVAPIWHRAAMDARFRTIAATAAEQHSAISLDQLQRLGVGSSMRVKWQKSGLIKRVGARSFVLGGSAPTWMRALTAAHLDLAGGGVVAGRSAARLMGLDDFHGDDIEQLVTRERRGRRPAGIVRSTRRAIPSTDLQRIDGLLVVRAERLIVDAPLFGFSRAEIENAIDSSIRLRLTAEQRLRTRVIADHRSGINGSRMLLDALVDSGGESRLERWFLRLCREAGLPRPTLQKIYRVDGRTVARVDAEFPGGLVIEVAGHGTHASRRQRQADEQRRTELTLMGKRVITFTYEDVRDRPGWVASRIAAALRLAA
jgi:hypothetical protein